MSDLISDLEIKLTEAARRRLAAGHDRHVRRWRLGGRGIAISVAVLTVAGGAVAAAVQLTASPSRPLAGPIDSARPSSRAYAVSLRPDLRPGQAGWCGLLRVATSAQTGGAGMGCGPAPAAGGAQIAAGGLQSPSISIEYAIVISDVRAVRFDRTLVATRADPALPNNWRYAVNVTTTAAAAPGEVAPRPGMPAARPSHQPRAAARPGMAPARPPAARTTATRQPQAGPEHTQTLLDGRGRALPATVVADDHTRQGTSRAVTQAHPTRRCVIGTAPGFIAGYARVAVSRPRLPARLQGRAFLSCANTVFHVHDVPGGVSVAILLDAQHPGRQAAGLPDGPDLTARRLGPGWLAVYGPDPSQRQRLINRLTARL